MAPGRPEDLVRTFAKRADAKHHLSKLKQDLGKGIPVEPSNLTLDQYLDQWVTSLRANKSSLFLWRALRACSRCRS